MSKANSNSNGVWVIVVVIAIAFLTLIFSGINSSRKESTRSKCKANDEVYVESSNTCRSKTTSEKFEEKCISGITVEGTKYTCSDIKKAGLENAYVNNSIVKHGNSLYEYGTYAEVQAGKNAGDYCLSASDTWSHIGETRCVVFTPARLAYQGYNYFLDEKENYTTGFVVYMYGNYGWNWFLKTYKDKGPILVCGKITTYQGHPQIKTAPSGTMVSPDGTLDGVNTVYKYSCN